MDRVKQTHLGERWQFGREGDRFFVKESPSWQRLKCKDIFNLPDDLATAFTRLRIATVGQLAQALDAGERFGLDDAKITELEQDVEQLKGV